MTRYVVSGYIGFDNFGDEAIARSLVERLKKSGAESITLISSNPQKTKKMHQVNSCGMFDFIKPIMQSDVLISGGGSLLQDVTSLKSLIYYLSVIYTAYLFGKKVEIFAQGIGPVNSKLGQFFTKFALKFASKISVRDTKSQELLKEWGIESELVKDPILELELPKSEKQGKVGVQLREFKGLNNEFLIRLKNELKKRFFDKQIVIFSLQDKIDLEISSAFNEMLKQEGLNSELKYDLSIDSAIDLITNLEYLIAMRFHANVIGIKSGVKTLAVNYDPKVEKLAKEFDIPMINLEQADISKEFDTLCH